MGLPGMLHIDQGHGCPGLRDNIDKTFLFHKHQRFADRRRADAECGRQFFG